jgi:multidrug efflux pump
MTSIAFCAGVIPLILGSGAGSEMRRAMGIAVFSGMVGVTLFGIFLTPMFYALLRGKVTLLRTGAGGDPAVVADTSAPLRPAVQGEGHD